MQRPVSDKTVDTAPLQRVIDMFAAMSAAILEGVLDRAALAKLKKISAEIERVSRELRRTSASNMKASALARLRSDSAYRARIRFELGGHHVITRWREKMRASNFPRQIELRAKRADYLQTLKINPDLKANPASGFTRGLKGDSFERAPERKSYERRDVKTDRDGLFRLAPVPTYLSTHIFNAYRAGQNECGRRVKRQKNSRKRLAPISLMPRDLDEPAERVGAEIKEVAGCEHVTAQKARLWPALTDISLDVPAKTKPEDKLDAIYVADFSPRPKTPIWKVQPPPSQARGAPYIRRL